MARRWANGANGMTDSCRGDLTLGRSRERISSHDTCVIMCLRSELATTFTFILQVHCLTSSLSKRASGHKQETKQRQGARPNRWD